MVILHSYVDLPEGIWLHLPNGQKPKDALRGLQYNSLQILTKLTGRNCPSVDRICSHIKLGDGKPYIVIWVSLEKNIKIQDW